MNDNIPFERRRIVRRSDVWTYRETELLRDLWPDVSALRKQLPHRKESALRNMAKRCGIIPPKEQHIWTGAEHKALKRLAEAGTPLKEIASQLKLSPLQVRNRMQYSGITIARRPLVPCPTPLAGVVRQRAFERKIPITELDRSLGNRKIFSHASVNKVSIRHIEKAVVALGGRLLIEWDDE